MTTDNGTSAQSLIEESQVLKELFNRAPRHILRHLEVVRFGKNHRVIEKGTVNPYIYILHDGETRIINEFKNGRVFEFCSINGNGSRIAFSGLLEFFSDNIEAASTVVTSSETTYLRITKRMFGEWLDSDFEAYRKVAKTFANQLYPSLNTIGVMKVFSGVYSLANHFIINYSDQLAVSDSVTVRETREELAEELGMSLRTVYRLCNELKKAGMILIENRKVRITPDAMEKLENFVEEIY